MVSPVFLQQCDFFELAMRNATTWDGKIWLVICTSCIQPDIFVRTFFRLKLLNQLANLGLVSIVQMLFEWNGFKQLLE